MKKTASKTVAPEKKKKPAKSGAQLAVELYEEAKTNLEEFLAEPDYKDVLREFETLIQARDERLDAAVREVKSELLLSDANALTVGEFSAQKRTKRYYDANYLADNIPVNVFRMFAKERLEYDIDTDTLEQMVRQGDLDFDLVKAAFKEEKPTAVAGPKNPKPFVIPISWK